MPNFKGNGTSITLLGLILAYPLVFMWQGLDVTDTGYYLVNCQQFFNAYPTDFGDAQCTAYWLTNFIGACWYKVTGECGLAGFRILYIIINYCTLALAYIAVRDVARKQSTQGILLGLFAAEAACIGSGTYIPSYNQVTALLFVASAVALFRGLTGGGALFVFIGGFIAGISVFARIVNFPIILFSIAVWYYQYVSDLGSRLTLLGSLKRSLGETVRFVVGFVSGIVLVLVLAAVLGHAAAFRDMFAGLLQMGAGAKGGGSHGAITLLKGFVWDYFYTGLCGIGFVGVALLVGSRARKTAGSWLWKGWIVLPGVATAFLLLRWPGLDVWAVPAMLYVILLAATFGILECRPELSLLCFLAGMLLFIIPLGSAAGIYVCLSAMYLAIPTALTTLMDAAGNSTRSDYSSRSTPPTRDAPREAAPYLQPAVLSAVLGGRGTFSEAKRRLVTILDTRAVAWACTICIITFSVVHRVGWTYRDSSDRLWMRTMVPHPKLRGVFTTASRARALEEVLRELQALVPKDGYLLDHMQFPMIYFLTETRPYLYSSWANVYEPWQFKKAMERALATRRSLPVCVLTKIDTSHPNWPDETYPPLPYYRHIENRRLFDDFLKDHSYAKTWANCAFEIWIPGRTSVATVRVN